MRMKIGEVDFEIRCIFVAKVNESYAYNIIACPSDMTSNVPERTLGQVIVSGGFLYEHSKSLEELLSSRQLKEMKEEIWEQVKWINYGT